jgi:hypothetical protein
MKKTLLVLILLLLLIPEVQAADHSNNKFGIHLAQPHFADLKAAKELVNSQGGDWGYVTLVIQENDRQREKWQEIFDRLREHHLIPIVRLATVPDGPSWRRPRKDGINDWVGFLDSLNWVVKNRYVILFNEPNHGSEWGGEVDAEDYAQVAFAFAKKLKEKNADFFVMLAGLDASAPSAPPNFEDEEIFLKKIIKSEILNPKSETNSNSQNSNNQNVLTKSDLVLNFKNSNFENCLEFRISCFELLIDGWASHSYPNPAFAGSPWEAGRGTVRTYQWELELLRSLGIEKNLPVFITETGWRRGNESAVAEYYRIAFENVWLPDEKVVAVTPFVLDYQGEPFLNFSWKRYGNDGFYPQYDTVQSLPKVKGAPQQQDRGEILFNLPGQLVAASSYQFKIKLKNLGQAIWDKDSSYQLSVIGNQEKPFEYLFSDIKNLKPYEEEEVNFFVKTRKETKNQNLKIGLQKKEKNIATSGNWRFEILPLPTLSVKVQLFPKLVATASDFEIQIFDEKENLVFKKRGLKIKGGQARVDDIQNIILGKKYRVVILKPYYLPRQEFIVFQKEFNEIKFKRMLPFDFNKNGRLDAGDLSALGKEPSLLRLFFL